jgi:hypothetical protein
MSEQKDFYIKDGELLCYLGDSIDIVIPDGVQRIGDAAFIEHKNIKSVALPKTLTWIGQCAFAHCESLKSITIPANVTFIDKSAFSDSGLEEVHIEGKPEIRLWAFDGTPYKANEFKKHGGLVRDNVLLSVNPELTEYTIPSDVKIIGRDAFKNSKIKEIDIPTGVIKLDICAFSYSELERISLPDTLRVIESHAFSNCENLTELTVPKSVTNIDDGAFQDLPNCVLTILNESDNEELFRISDHAFAFGQLTPNIKEVRVPYGSVAMRYAVKAGLNVTTFAGSPKKFGNPKKYEYVDEVFCCCGGTLREYFGQQDVVHIPEGVHTIEAKAFWCSKVKKVYLPCSVKVIDKDAFDNCQQLEEIVGEGVLEIGRNAFDFCEELKRVEFPNLKRCYDISFKHCNRLKRKNIIIPEDAEIIMEAEEPWRCGCGHCFFTRTPFTPVEMVKKAAQLKQGIDMDIVL